MSMKNVFFSLTVGEAHDFWGTVMKIDNVMMTKFVGTVLETPTWLSISEKDDLLLLFL